MVLWDTFIIIVLFTSAGWVQLTDNPNISLVTLIWLWPWSNSLWVRDITVLMNNRSHRTWEICFTLNGIGNNYSVSCLIRCVIFQLNLMAFVSIPVYNIRIASKWPGQRLQAIMKITQTRFTSKTNQSWFKCHCTSSDSHCICWFCCPLFICSLVRSFICYFVSSFHSWYSSLLPFLPSFLSSFLPSFLSSFLPPILN